MASDRAAEGMREPMTNDRYRALLRLRTARAHLMDANHLMQCRWDEAGSSFENLHREAISFVDHMIEVAEKAQAALAAGQTTNKE